MRFFYASNLQKLKISLNNYIHSCITTKIVISLNHQFFELL